MVEVNAAATGMSSASSNDHAGKYFNIPVRGSGERLIEECVKLDVRCVDEVMEAFPPTKCKPGWLFTTLSLVLYFLLFKLHEIFQTQLCGTMLS